MASPGLTGTLVTSPLTNLQKASEKLREHFEGVKGESAKKYHLKALQTAEMFVGVMTKKQLPIDQQLSQVRTKTIAKNKQILKSIVDTIIFCGRQGIALRGHRDSIKHVDLENISTNPGNFLALLKFRVDSGDEVLANHLATCGKNASFTSKNIQNQLIDICGSIIQSTLLSQVKAAKVYSIMTDEATDVSNKEQLAICVRYVQQSTVEIDI